MVRRLVLACLWRSTVAFVVAPLPARSAPGQPQARWATSVALPFARARPRLAAPPRMSAGAGELRDSFAPGIALVPGAQAQNLAAHGAAIVFVPQARANLTAASDARSAPLVPCF
jgi:hypothetical protein